MAQLFEILKQRREALGYSQEYVANLIKKTGRMYQYYEEGKKKPGITTLFELSKILKFDLAELANEPVIIEYKQQHEPTLPAHTEKYIALLERQNESSLNEIKLDLKEFRQNLKSCQEGLGELKEYLQANSTLLKALAQHMVKLRAKVEKADPEKLEKEMDKSLTEIGKAVLKEGKMNV